MHVLFVRYNRPPKGIFKMDRGQLSWGQQPPIINFCAHLRIRFVTRLFGSCALYHAAGLAWSMNVLRAGHSGVVNKFDSPRDPPAD